MFFWLFIACASEFASSVILMHPHLTTLVYFVLFPGNPNRKQLQLADEMHFNACTPPIRTRTTSTDKLG